MDMEGPDSDNDATRRTLLRVLAAAGLTGAGITGASGSAAAHSTDHKKGHGKKRGKGHGKKRRKGRGKFDEHCRRFKCHVKRNGKIEEECDAVDRCEVGEEVVFDGTLTITGVELSDTNEVLVSGRLQGTLEGDESEEIDEPFEDVSLGTLQEIFTVRPADDPEDCPILEINIGGLCLEILGLRVQLETIEIDPVGILGEDNLVSDLVCDLLRRLSSS
ncbi:hypothetical protein [Halalkalicoccus salilacus]|uniref:hypothetical protein n=2 Tax=Halococcaceae TaxID=1963270 RepID=UPI002F968174